ncbi:MAG: outer membrane protein assembly factor BamA [Treponema sp.]|nr:outer membrane protein assembly factor BamA [Treponema sp.]
MKFKLFALIMFTSAVLGFSQESNLDEEDWFQEEELFQEEDRYQEEYLSSEEEYRYHDDEDLPQEEELSQEEDRYQEEYLSSEEEYRYHDDEYLSQEEELPQENEWYQEEYYPQTTDLPQENYWVQDNVPQTPAQTQDDDWFQGKPIRDIVFSGLRNIPRSELEALMQPFYGRNFNDIIFWEIQSRLYALEYFERIEPSINSADANNSEVVIRFSVIERPVVVQINFAGNSGVRTRELREVISTKTSDIYNQAKIRIDIEAIENKYAEKGFPNVAVNVEESRNSSGDVTLVFRISERDRISISRIEFEGNTRFSNNALRSKLSLKAKSLINNGAFQEAKLVADREAVAMYYHERGYIDAVVRDVTRTYEQGSKGINLILTFMIDEGEEFSFGGITFEGNRIFSSEQLSKLVTSKVGEIVNMTKLEMDLQSVVDLYSENGYIFNSIVREPQRTYRPNVLSYTISIVERNRAYVENIIIIGNEKTRTGVILREIPLEPGDVFSKTKLMNALRNLYNLQYFSNIIPDVLPGSAENLMDLIFTVEEQMTTDVQVGLTFSGSSDPDTFPISGLFEWTDRNLAGTGNEFGIKLSSSIVSSTTVALNYIHRWILGLPLSLGTDLTADFIKRHAPMRNQTHWFYGNEEYAFPDGFSSYEEYVNNNKRPPSEYLMEYDQWYLSLGLSSGYRWITFLGNLSLGGGMRFGILRNNYNEVFEPFDPALRERNSLWTPRNSLWSSLSLDSRDIFYDPSSGYYLQERIGFFGIFKNEREHYIRSDAKAQYFLTLFDLPVTRRWSFKSVLAMNVGLSSIFKQPGRDPGALTPKIEDANKLAVDGMFSARGWSDQYRYKGLLLLDSWVELRFPIVRGILALDLFFDAAGVESKEGYYFGKDSDGNKNFTINNLRFSYGGGLRVAMPQFPIRASLAKRFRFIDGQFTWEPGAIFKNEANPTSGIDFVLSFVMSY